MKTEPETSKSSTKINRGLSAGHFRKIATNGFGDGGNAYSWGCTWYKDHLYIGTNRLVLVIYKKRIRYNMNTDAWPVEVNSEDQALDLRGQVWRYSPDKGTWERVFLSPLTEGIGGKKVPLACGFRHLTLFQGKTDPHPVIYSIPGSGFDSLGPTLLRCEDGENFVPSSEPGLGVGDPNIVAYRGAISFKGRLFISPAGYKGGHVNIAYGAPVFCSDDPVSGTWAASNTPGFGDETNHGIFDIGVCGDFLYAGTINIRGGAQLWKTDGEGPAPHRWTKVFDCGADRGAFNQGIYCFAAFQGNLYLGTAIQNGGNDRENNIGPGAGEVIRVYPDDTWDVVVGEPRLTPKGLRLPTSGLGAGFDDPFNGYIWRMCAHDGALYVGTLDAFGFFSFTSRSEWPRHVQNMLDDEFLETLLERRGGCKLWRTTDGDHWTPVTVNGFGNPYNWGVRAMVSTPRGLFVGTANPFGPNVAVRGATGWRYEPNSRGGLEVWHGSFDHAGCGENDAGTVGLRDMDFMLGSAKENVIVPNTPRLEASSLASPKNPFVAGKSTHDVRDWTAAEDRIWRAGPTSLLNEIPKDLQGLSENIEDEVDMYFGGKLQCCGYWSRRRFTPKEACAQLIEELCWLAPVGSSENARVLLLGPHAFAVKEYLSACRPAWAIDIATAQDFDATKVAVKIKACDEATYDTVLCVEGIELRESAATLPEIRRVLKSTGAFLATYLPGKSLEETALAAAPATNNWIIKEYKGLLARAGFAESLVLDVTAKTWMPFVRHSREHFGNRWLFSQLDEPRYREILNSLPGGGRVVQACLWIAAGNWRK